ncbi:LysR family transcriptional regulator [Marinobacter bohaiensis]|uniref:LysR family transcriptional regulator n=1 Tax=Marinobacter bohaiensis TaxID=2201898 RepID=UPI000DADB721|nr:LysR family transcriptional regulator [Marinobacter bohaiensis]
MKLPPLRALPVFEAVARLNSFSRAADELSVSQSAVSHQIKALEDYLGETLFRRNGRYLELTEEGRSYQDSVTSALLQIERASEHLLGASTSRLRLAVFSSFCVRWLIPRLPSLQRAHSQIDLALEMTGESPVLSDRVADCFITIRTASPAFTYDLLYRERLFPICSRAYWRRICDALDLPPDSDPKGAASLTPEQVARFPLLSTFSIYDRESGDWDAWFRVADERLPAGARIQHFSHMLMALEAARYDQGIALTNDYMLSDEADDNLVRLPCHTLMTGDRFYFAHKTSRRNEPAIRLVRRWLIEQAIASGLRSRHAADES